MLGLRKTGVTGVWVWRPGLPIPVRVVPRVRRGPGAPIAGLGAPTTRRGPIIPALLGHGVTTLDRIRKATEEVARFRPVQVELVPVRRKTFLSVVADVGRSLCRVAAPHRPLFMAPTNVPVVLLNVEMEVGAVSGLPAAYQPYGPTSLAESGRGTAVTTVSKDMVASGSGVRGVDP